MAPQDTYIDEDEDYCPLCIEPLDLSDRNFKPCPCGYQICQFCFNNIKTNMNNLCPACRRPYDDKTIQWKVVTPEEIAEFKNRIKQNQKNRAAEQRQKEAQKREAEKENRKNLVGVRVVQKNLVYVTGLTPTIREDELLKTLRKSEFFGQYGTIQKISISNRKSSDGQQQSLGVYVTFEKDEEALRCIGAVNNSPNGDRILRAQLGTTKYCSAWLRHEVCSNRQCMFLHELGDEEDSYTRQDLSSMNSINTQRPLASGSGSRSASRQQTHPSPAPAAAQLMVRSNSKDESENGDGPALPATANWARNPPVRSRRGSHATSGAAPSPAISHALPVTAESAEEAVEEPPAEEPVAGPSGSSSSPAMTKLEKAKRIPTDTLASLLKSLSGCTLAWPKVGDAQQSDISYPPLFDVRGWERRRALRDDEESGLAEEQDEPHAVREPSEGEPESSGSLALGGEPEDHGRDSHFDRRPSQPPIQRINNEGLFGPALGASFNHANASLGSIGSRTVTPQQPAFLRPQGAFDNASGISAQTSLFPGQGHNRQGSRFTFASDNRDAASSTTVKIAANPRIMAQQSSMMPSSFHAQPSNQYYATSMPGPPPGLKSTGTPPSMFGQHGFGSAFRGVSKDSNDILQLINQPRAAGNQGHDAGKRELMFPSYPTQYPPSTSSTPAPATSLLASLYGPPQPNGAFQDFGSKQKKKGKKHRHANTSSSGGSGLVDLADPSILQARMQSQHLQQQSNAGLGQGLFGGQAQDDDLLSLEEVTTSIDALVSDEPISASIRQPPGSFESFVRSVTPSVPPGLGLPHSHLHASPAISHSSIHGPNIGRQTPPVVTPIAPIKSTVPPASPLAGKKATSASGSDAKKNIKALAAESGLSKEIAKAKTQQQKVLQDEDFPALDTPKSTNVTPVVAHAVPSKASGGKANAAASKKNAEKDKEKENTKPAAQPSRTNTPKPEPRVANEKRPVPGILNIAAATKAAAQAAKANEQAATTEKSVHEKDSAFPALPTPSVAPVTTASPLTRAAPKTLRVVSTPKAETPQTPAGGVPVSATASVRSSAAFRPETPVSEMISDSASIISASISASRTNSPPPSKVGSAPVRITTKSQQRKQRKEALKKDTATIATQPVKIEPEVEIAPIIGRKKKQKKEKETKEKPSNQKEKEKAAVSINATPTASRPETPVANPAGSGAGAPSKEAATTTTTTIAAAAKEETSTYRSTANETTTLTEESAHQHKRRIEESRNMAEAGARTGDSGANSTPKNVPTAASILKELQEAGLVPKDIESLPFFKPVSSHADRARSDKTPKNPTTPATAIVSAEDQALLLAGQPVRKIVDGVRVLLTPNGDCVKNLTEEEEDRFLELQAEIAKLASDPAAFVSSRHEAPGGFSLIKGRAVPNGPPSYFPQAPGAFPTDPVNKIQREEALTYINQYVLPRLNLNARDMSFPKAMAGEWSSAHGGDRTSNNNGASSSSVTGLANAAANLNSLAPWMYGGSSSSVHDGSDTAAPELNYPGPVGAFADAQSYLEIGGRSSVVDDLSDVAHNAFNTAAAAAAAHTAAVNASGRSLSAAAAAAAAAANAAHAGGASSIANGAGTAPGSFGNVPLMTLEDAEQALAVARKETDKLEKSLNQFLRKNRRLLTLVGGAAGAASAVGSGGGH